MASKIQTAFVTPWCYVKAREEIIHKMFSCESLEPFGPRDSMTFFNNRKNVKIFPDTITGYDRLHDRTPYDQTKPRCDRAKQAIIWRGIHRENKSHRVPMVAGHWYGRPNRVHVDFPDGKFNRSNEIQDNFYRRNGTNLSTNNNRELLE